MTGQSARAWNWLYSLALPLVLAWVDATWVTTWVGAVGRIGRNVPPHLPVTTVGFPESAAVLLASLATWAGWSRRIRLLLGVPVVLVLGVLTARSIAWTMVHGSLVSLSAGWLVHGSSATDVTVIAALLAVFAWLRGLWLGREGLTVETATNTLALAFGALVLFFILARLEHEAIFHVKAEEALLLALVLAPGVAAVGAFLHERQLERDVIQQHLAPNTRGLLLTGAIALGVAAVALVLVGLVLRAALPLGGAGHVLRSDVPSWITAFGNGLARVVHPNNQRAVTVPQPIHTKHFHHGHPNSGAVTAFEVLLIVAIVVALLAVLLLVTWFVRRMLRSRRDRRAGRGVRETRTSEWSFKRLRQRLLAGLGRRGQGAVEGEPTAQGSGSFAGEESSVRGQYRRVLFAARDNGRPRGLAETPAEFRGRLGAELGEEEQLRRLTELYERARYDPDGGSVDAQEAAASAAAVLAGLRDEEQPARRAP